MATNAAEALFDAAERDPAGIALVHAGARISYDTLAARVDAFARGLRDRGLRRGDRVGLVTANRIEFIVAHYGSMHAGLISVPINPSLTAPEIAQRTHVTAPALVICDASSEVAVREGLMLNQLGTERVITVGSPAWGDLIRPDHLPVDFGATDPESVGSLMFTAGAGGPPQAAMLSHRALIASVDQLLQLEQPPVIAEDTVLLSLPLVHSYALFGVLALAVRVGATVVLERRFEADESLRTVEHEQVSAIAAGPGLYSAWATSLTESPALVELLGSVRAMAFGHAPLSASVAEQFLAATGHRVWEAYGMSQATAFAAITESSGVVGSVGRPLPGVEMRIIDTDGEEVDDDDDPGELLIRGANLFSGFWPDGDLGPAQDGWYSTGDVGYLDHDSNLHLVNRRLDLIVVNGFSVYPHEVESVLTSIDGVHEAAVVGIPNEQTGEAVRALVVVAPDSGLDSDQIVAQCAARLARFKLPTIVEFVDALPRLSNGQFARQSLREWS